MPFLRVLRDRRGYETTYLMHWFREGSRQRSRVLYIFRTPANVRVGRNPLDPDALRDIEARYPDIDFNWNEVREQQHVIEPGPPLRRKKPKRDEEPGVPVDVAETPSVESSERPQAHGPVPIALEGTTADEQIAFLMIWYPIVRERVATRMTDPERREALAALAERLNPAAWTDADQIATGLQQAAEALERLSRVLVRRRRRARRRSGPTEAESATSSSPILPEEPTPQES